MIHDTRMTLEKIANRLSLIEPLVYRSRWNLPPFLYKMYPEGAIKLPITDIEDEASWQSVAGYRYWGFWNSEFVMVNEFALPAEFQGRTGLALYLPFGESGDFNHPEALAYVNGRSFAACDRNHQELLLPADWQDGAAHLLVLHGWTGLGGKVGAEPTKLFMRPCQLVQIDQPTRDFVALVRIALGVARNLGDDEPARAWILNALDDAFKVLDTSEPLDDKFYASVLPAKAVLDAGIKKAGAAKEVNIYATGHAHIDVAWLWPLAQTRHKASRTFHNVLGLMDRFPNFHFSQSQPQLYEFVRQDFPELFEKIQKKVDEGRWEILGGMWLEADCNLSGAESLARQFLLGRSYFSQYFGEGKETPVLWLPDAFGFSYSLPQLIKQAGLNYFFSIKMSWNQYNAIPYDTFWWQGLDGSRVLTHFSTTPSVGNEWKAATYNAEVEPGQVLASWKRFKQKELHPNLLMAYGFGDGGGGPTAEMVENLQIMGNFPATPRVRSGSVAEFFKALEEDSSRLPTWNGELYLELHRGTYTTQSRNKRANRKSEFGLHDAEFLASTAAMLNADYTYPHAALTHNWQLVCLNQFHDILPGSSVEKVYQDSQSQYQEVIQSARELSAKGLTAIAGAFSDSSESQTFTGILLANPTSFKRDDLFYWPGYLDGHHHFTRADGSVVYSQKEENGVWLTPGPVEPYGFLSLKLEAGAQNVPIQGEVRANRSLLENDFLRVEINEEGDIIRIFDKANQREVLPAGCIANQFQAFEDRPIYWDAWDVDRAYDDKLWLSEPAHEIRLVAAGPLRGTIEIKRRILHSEYVQQISLSWNSPRLDFSTTIQWREKHILLKTAFPVDVLANQATYEIQWGNLQRATHENTSWDWARFEVCAHKWADLSQGDYGVSLLNDCKFGHDVHDGVMRLSLLRSPTDPDAHADEGEHTFAYSLLPHEGGWDERTIAAAYALNDPWQFLPLNGPIKKADYSLVSVDSPNVVIETVKQAEDGNGLIVRLYESRRFHSQVTLQTGFGLAGAWVTDLLENSQEEIPTFQNRIKLDIRPYQIITLRLKPE